MFGQANSAWFQAAINSRTCPAFNYWVKAALCTSVLAPPSAYCPGWVCSPGLMVANSCHRAVPTVREELGQPRETALPSNFTISVHFCKVWMDVPSATQISGCGKTQFFSFAPLLLPFFHPTNSWEVFLCMALETFRGSVLLNRYKSKLCFKHRTSFVLHWKVILKTFFIRNNWFVPIDWSLWIRLWL